MEIFKNFHIINRRAFNFTHFIILKKKEVPKYIGRKCKFTNKNFSSDIFSLPTSVS